MSRGGEHPVWRVRGDARRHIRSIEPAHAGRPGTKPLLLVAACALIDIDGRVLLARRPEGKKMAGLWEFPGGKLHHGETPEAALIRELKEELGIDVSAACLAPFAFASHAYERFHLLMPLYLCRRWKGIAEPRENQTLAWVRPQQARRLPDAARRQTADPAAARFPLKDIPMPPDQSHRLPAGHRQRGAVGPHPGRQHPVPRQRAGANRHSAARGARDPRCARRRSSPRSTRCARSSITCSPPAASARRTTTSPANASPPRSASPGNRIPRRGRAWNAATGRASSTPHASAWPRCRAVPR